MKKIISLIWAMFIGVLFTPCITPMTKANAGQSEFIIPLFSGYVENEEKTTIITQNTVIDISNYNGAGGIDFDAGKITATSNYMIFNAQAGATFCIPYMGTMDELNEVKILINGQLIQAERLYGEYPFYFAGEDSGYLSVTDAIKSVQPTTIKDGMGKVYIFESVGGEIEFSFQKNVEQTVIHNGASWSSQGVHGYSFKGKNSDMQEYPYRVFVSNGELIDFQSNVEYPVSDISYKGYVDYHLNEWIAELGEEYRPHYYSKFNRVLSGGVYDVSDVLYDYSVYSFVLMKVELPIGISQIVVNSGVYALINTLYKPYTYTIRTITPYSQAAEYSLTIIPSEKLPCLVEQNIGLKDFSYVSNKQIEDWYYVMSADKNPDYVLDNNAQQKDRTWILYLGLSIGGVALLGVPIIMRLKKPK